jgi:hypothetical protein
MTTRRDLIEGFQMIIREGQRVMSTFGPDDWKRAVHGEEDGWDRKQVYAHLAATAEIVPAFVGNLASRGGDGQDAAAGFDINAFNAQQVARMEQLGEQELMETFKTAHEKLIAFVETIPEDQLEVPAKFGHVEGTVAEVMDSTLVLHALAHIYSAGGSAV